MGAKSKQIFTKQKGIGKFLPIPKKYYFHFSQPDGCFLFCEKCIFLFILRSLKYQAFQASAYVTLPLVVPKITDTSTYFAASSAVSSFIPATSEVIAPAPVLLYSLN